MLKALYELNQRVIASGDKSMGTKYFGLRDVSGCINIDLVGNYLGIVNLMQPYEGKDKNGKTVTKYKDRTIIGPAPVVRTNGAKPGFLIDKLDYVLNYNFAQKEEEKDEEKEEKEQKKAKKIKKEKTEVFADTIDEVIGCAENPSDDLLEIQAAISSFYRDELKIPGLKEQIAEDFKKALPCSVKELTQKSFTVAINGDPVWDFPEIQECWMMYKDYDLSPDNSKNTPCICSVTGQRDIVYCTTNWPRIKKLPGGQSSGMALASANQLSQKSYGAWPDSFVGANAAIGAVNAVNYLINDESHHLVVGKTYYLFWAKDEKVQRLFSFLTSGRWNGSEDRPNEQIAEIMEKVKAGADDGAELDSPFYFLTIQANAARVSLVDYRESTWGDLRKNLSRYFDDLRMIGVDPKRLILGNLMGGPNYGSGMGLGDAIKSPAIIKKILDAVFLGRPFPLNLLPVIVNQAKRNAVRNKKDSADELKKTMKIDLLAALAKGALIRAGKGDKLMDGLNKDNNNIGYLLGRQFAVDELLNSEVGVNKKFKQQYFSMALTTPKRYLVAAEKTRARAASRRKYTDNPDNASKTIVRADKATTEIMSKIDTVPSTLSKDEQAMAVVGYYHQRKDWFTKKEKAEVNAEVETETPEATASDNE